VPGSRDSETLLDWVSHARTRFARHRMEKPATKAGQIRALWPDIEAALEGGQSMKSIRQWLEEDAGITLGLTSLTSYISRIRRRLAAPNARSSVATQATASPASEDDPLAQAKRALSQPKLDIRKLHNDGDPRGRNLI
jgi:hypothetical protein